MVHFSVALPVKVLPSLVSNRSDCFPVDSFAKRLAGLEIRSPVNGDGDKRPVTIETRHGVPLGYRVVPFDGLRVGQVPALVTGQETMPVRQELVAHGPDDLIATLFRCRLP